MPHLFSNLLTLSILFLLNKNFLVPSYLKLHTDGNVWKLLLQIMEKLTCAFYGFECEFVTEGKLEDVIDKFKIHTEDEHGIDYSKEALMQFIIRQN